MDYGSGIELILRENGQYLLQLVLFVYRLVLAIICLILYFLLVFILYIVYLIFYPERRYKRKIEDKNASLDTENQYKKRRLYGSLIGLGRGLVGGIVIMAFIGSFFYIAGGTGNNKYDKAAKYDDQGNFMLQHVFHLGAHYQGPDGKIWWIPVMEDFNMRAFERKDGKYVGTMVEIDPYGEYAKQLKEVKI